MTLQCKIRFYFVNGCGPSTQLSLQREQQLKSTHASCSRHVNDCFKPSRSDVLIASHYPLPKPERTKTLQVTNQVGSPSSTRAVSLHGKALGLERYMGRQLPLPHCFLRTLQAWVGHSKRMGLHCSAPLAHWLVWGSHLVGVAFCTPLVYCSLSWLL